jgi:hypothetical protein
MSTHDHPDRDPAGRDDREGGERSAATRSEASLRRIGEALHGLKYGSVVAIVQDGVVVQIERTEKTRLGK